MINVSCLFDNRFDISDNSDNDIDIDTDINVDIDNQLES